MADILFYHLTSQPLERVLPSLLEKTIDRGWKALVRTGSQERVAAIDDLLWTYSEESFLPHATEAEGDVSDEAILITAGATNGNAANVCFLLDGVSFPADPSQFERIVLMFDDADTDVKQAARDQWKTIKASGLDASYWQQNERGGWEKKA
ncbi:MAG: DNA polymerase III subunit chi [Beijerinckiaceae bacterium]